MKIKMLEKRVEKLACGIMATAIAISAFFVYWGCFSVEEYKSTLPGYCYGPFYYQGVVSDIKTETTSVLLDTIPDEYQEESSQEDLYAGSTWEYYYRFNYEAAVIFQKVFILTGNPYCASAVVGNCMIEVSDGQPHLDLDVTAWNRDGIHYGMCQWNTSYSCFSELADASFEKQIEFLISDMEKEFNKSGWRMESGYNWESFCNEDSARDAALAFAKVYEKCSSKTYSGRQNCASYVCRVLWDEVEVVG